MVDYDMVFHNDTYLVKAYNDPTYTRNSLDNVREYHQEYVLCHPSSITSRHGYVGGGYGHPLNSCILFAGAGPTIVHTNSGLIVEDQFFAAIGDLVACLNLPLLELMWYQAVDSVTCFGIHYSPKFNCLVSHGECDIARISLSGQVEWKVSGADILTEGFTLQDLGCDVVDFNGTRYWVNLCDGNIKIIDG